MSESKTAEHLLEDAAWLRRLAVTLAGNESDADDLVQESWIAAWRRQPDTDRPLRPWLAKVVRDVAGMKRRSERRRAAREEAAVPLDDAGAAPDALLDQMRLHRLIVDLVLELDEPYRTTIIARFVEGRTAAQIARSAGIPESTVRGRIRDGLARLREGLDTARGERSRWAPAVLAFAKGGLQMAKPTKSILVIIGLLALLLGGVALITTRDSGTSQKQQTAATTAGTRGAGTSASGDIDVLSPSFAMPAWIAPRGVAGRRIAGHVTYRGAPVKDATVTLQSVFTRASGGEPVEMSQTMRALLKPAGLLRAAEIRTGADGAFDFGMLPATVYDVTAMVEGKTAAIAHVNLTDPTLKPPADALDLRLRDCTGSVEGTVVDASENPIAKARVLLDALVGVETDARGRYKLCVPFGDVNIEYNADGYGAVRLTIDGRGEMLRDVVLVPEATVTVRAVRSDTGAVVPDAHVNVFAMVFGEADRPAPRTGITNLEGRVRIDRLVPGRYRVTGFSEGLQAFTPVETLVEVGVGTEVVVRLDATVRIAGKVVDHGQPVAGAYVAVARKSPATRSPPSVTQADGSFVIDRAPPGDLVFLAAPYEVESPAAYQTKPGTSYDGVTIEVRRGATIRGTVTRYGKPVEGVGVCCVRTIGTQQPSALTDAQGHYVYEGVVPGTYDVFAGSDELGAFKMPTKVTIGAGEEKVVDHELDMAGAITGVVVDKSGEPVKGVFVRWANQKTGDQGRGTTDAKGRYRCGTMSGGGTYRASVFPSAFINVAYPTADGGAYPSVDVKDGTSVVENVTIEIDRPALALSGEVVDDAGHPVADALVKALPTAGGPPQFHSWLRLPSTSTDADGRFTIGELAPGNYAIQARATDGAEGVLPPVVAGTKGLVLRIERAGSIEGTLAGFAQPPVVYARTFGEFKLLPGTVEGATFRVAGLRPGKYLVNAQNTFEGDAHVVEVRPGQPTKVTMTSHGQGTIEGTVLDFRTRKPIANAACHVVMAVDGEQTITNWDLNAVPKSDGAGRVLLDPAPAGSVNVNCQMPGMKWSSPSADVTLAAGARATVQLFSVELARENPSTIGIDFDWRTTAPRIADVDSNSPGAKAGLLAGDLITEVNGTSVQGLNGQGVGFLIGSIAAGSDVRLVVQRGGAAKTLTVKAAADTI